MQDTTFELERKRNRPEKYNREVVAKTLNAIKKISKIRVRRQERFYEQRMRNAKKVNKVVAKKEIEKQACTLSFLAHMLFVENSVGATLVHSMLQSLLHGNLSLSYIRTDEQNSRILYIL